MTNPENSAKLAQFFPPARKSLLNAEVLKKTNALLSAAQLEKVVRGIATGKVMPGHSGFARIQQTVRAGLDTVWTATGQHTGRDAVHLRADHPLLQRTDGRHDRHNGALGPHLAAGALTARAATGPSQRRDALAGWLFVAPQLAGIATFVVLPLVLVAWYSLHEWNVLANTFNFVGTRNYQQLLHDPNLPGCCGLGLVLGRAGGVQPEPGAAAGRAAEPETGRHHGVSHPVLFARGGVAGGLDHRLGFSAAEQRRHQRRCSRWASRGPTGCARRDGDGSVIVVQVFKNVGLNMVLFLAALQGVPGELYEAARIDGVPRFKQFRRITLPLISPTIMLTSIITVVGSLQVFAQIAVLTQGGPGVSTTVLVYYLYQQTFQFHMFGYGSTLAIVLFVIVAGVDLCPVVPAQEVGVP